MVVGRYRSDEEPVGSMRLTIRTALVTSVVVAPAACASTPTLGESSRDVEAPVAAQNQRLDDLDAALSVLA